LGQSQREHQITGLEIPSWQSARGMEVFLLHFLSSALHIAARHGMELLCRFGENPAASSHL